MIELADLLAAAGGKALLRLWCVDGR